QPPPEADTQTTSSQTAQLCGRVTSISSQVKLEDAQVLLFRTDRSFLPNDEMDVAADGTFCFTDLRPGSYHLAFVRRVEDWPVSFAWYSGTAIGSESSVVQIESGYEQSDLLFKIPSQPTFPIRGNVLTNSGATLPPESMVFLISADASSSLIVSYSQ